MKLLKIITAILSALSIITSACSFFIFDKSKINGIRRWLLIVGCVVFAILSGLLSVSLREVPYTIGGNVDNAIQTVQERGFKNIEIIPNEYGHSDKVVNQNPKEGYESDKTKIILWVETDNVAIDTEALKTDNDMADVESNEVDDYGQEQTSETTAGEESSEEFDDTYESYFNLTETHSPDDAMNTCYINNWSKEGDIDVRGVTYDKGVLYEFNNTLALLGGSSADEIQSDLRFAFIPGNPKPNVFRAKVVVHNDSAGTNATAKISWIVDDVESGELEEINGNTIKEIPIEIDISNMEYYFTIHVSAMPYGDGIKFGIVDYKFE